jgi:hypothetical protein
MRTVKMSILICFFLTAAPLAAQAPVSTGGLAGCITDAMGQRLPRATVAVSAQGVQHTVVADANGCYEFTSLPLHSYRVTARLTGFDNVTRERVKIAANEITRADLTTRPSTICECLTLTTLAAWREHADAVVYLRITDHETQLPAPPGFFKQTAEVLEVLKGHAAGGPTDAAMAVLEDQSSGALDPANVGDEFVMFLQWSPGEGTFVGWKDRVFAIERGRIVRSPLTYGRLRIDDLLVDLRELSK